MNLSGIYRRDGTFLTPIDGQYALIDQDRETIFILNNAGAWVWSSLGSEITIPAEWHEAVEQFVAELSAHQLLQLEKDAISELAQVGSLDEKPAILHAASLQVAAGNSTDPFDVGW